MALLPPAFINSVVAIGTKMAVGQIVWVASGFLYGHHILQVNEKESLSRVYLITNRHVLEEHANIVLRFNPLSDQPAREFTLNFSGDAAALRFYHPDPEIDIGAVAINVNSLKRAEIHVEYFHSHEHVANRGLAQKIGLFEGDFCYLLGFPLGLVGEQRNYVIARHGTIARISDFLGSRSKDILIDCMIFPGNSGGPVVTKPEVLSIEGTQGQNNSYLLGIVRSYIPYQDVAISNQTKRPRIIFEENSGLAKIVPAHFLIEWMTSLPQNIPTPEELAKYKCS